MRSLGLRCHRCGRLFATALLAPVYGRPRLSAFEASCPGCHARETYESGELVPVRG